jgi:hypothetical protein
VTPLPAVETKRKVLRFCEELFDRNPSPDKSGRVTKRFVFRKKSSTQEKEHSRVCECEVERGRDPFV